MGNIANIPIVKVNDLSIRNRIDDLVRENISISKTDWDSFETSWNFQRHPILTHKGDATTIEQAFENWENFAENQFYKLKANEEELNRIFIDVYGLQDEISPEVDKEDVTVSRADRERDIKSFISYAVGCMFGRYSTDVDGLIYAGGHWEDKWKLVDGQWRVRGTQASFAPDGDNVITILTDVYFEDDIVSRFVEFVSITFGAENLEENLDYIAQSLGKRASETSRETIRRYFLRDFYRDHVKMYRKLPIYWLFSSGKRDGFKALIYMHRYDESTVAKIRTEYLHNLQGAYDTEISRIDLILESDVSIRERNQARKKKEIIQKQIEECAEYDQVIGHIANQRLQIDLDDGVGENYSKFQDIEIFQEKGKIPLKADLLAKIRS